MIQEVLAADKHALQVLHDDPNITQFSDLTNKAVESLHDLNQENVSNIRWHLRRRKENEMDGINFVTVTKRVLVFPETLPTPVVVKRLYEQGIELNRVQKTTSNEKSIFTSVSAIRAQGKNIECKILWPRQAADVNRPNV